MASKTEKIHLCQVSLGSQQSTEDVLKDLAARLEDEPDVIALTQTNDHQKDIAQAGRAAGYQFVGFPVAGEAFLVKKGPNLAVKRKSSVLVSAETEAAQYISWVVVTFHGKLLTLHAARWAAYVADDPARASAHSTTTRAMARLVRQHGEAEGISFFMGDLRYNYEGDSPLPTEMSPGAIFKEQGLLLVFTEFDREPPPTMGEKRTVDIIGAYKRDKNVVATRYKVWPQVKSSHRAVSAWYDIDLKAKFAIGGTGSGNGGGGKPDDKDDFFATGGNQDFSDYQDNELYDLPYAIDDSDSDRR